MTLVAKDTGGASLEPLPTGTHLARCVQVIDLGLQHSEFYGSTKHKIRLGWELPEVRYEDEEGNVIPRMAWREFTLSLHTNSALRGILETWRGRAFTAEELTGFDLRNIVGVPCMVTIVHSEQGGITYSNVNGVVAVPSKGIEPLKQFHSSTVFDIEQWQAGDSQHQKMFDDFSEKTQDKIRRGAETMQQVQNDAAPAEPSEDLAPQDDIPF